MTELKNIPHLIQLLDDDNEVVRHHVLRELSAFGPILKTEIQRQGLHLNKQQERIVYRIFQYQSQIDLKSAWSSWLNKPSDQEKLEAAMTMFSDYLSHPKVPGRLPFLLDNLAVRYRERYYRTNARLLARFLFEQLSLSGDEDDYYDPQNSNLVSVIEKKKGIPISLASVYMLVGKRLGLQIEGCHFPGHFLAKIRINGRNVFIDCFNGGQVIERGDILSGRQDIADGIDEILNENVIPETIIRRYLANLIRAFQLKNDMQNVRLMTYFFDSIDYWVNRESIRNFSPDQIIQPNKGRFHAGQVVRHKSYGYRGIVVASDQFCMASDEWYYGNQTQPDRNQPWLHVFVDGSDQVTYVAESNLIEDSDKKKIEHPLLTYFFTEDKAKGYVRNSNNWPETDF